MFVNTGSDGIVHVSHTKHAKAATIDEWWSRIFDRKLTVTMLKHAHKTAMSMR